MRKGRELWKRFEGEARAREKRKRQRSATSCVEREKEESEWEISFDLAYASAFLAVQSPQSPTICTNERARSNALDQRKRLSNYARIRSMRG